MGRVTANGSSIHKFNRLSYPASPANFEPADGKHNHDASTKRTVHLTASSFHQNEPTSLNSVDPLVYIARCFQLDFAANVANLHERTVGRCLHIHRRVNLWVDAQIATRANVGVAKSSSSSGTWNVTTTLSALRE
jgi:hypothetical protein